MRSQSSFFSDEEKQKAGEIVNLLCGRTRNEIDAIMDLAHRHVDAWFAQQIFVLPTQPKITREGYQPDPVAQKRFVAGE